MAKNRKKSSERVSTTPTALRNDAFAGLAGLRAQLPTGDPAPDSPSAVEPSRTQSPHGLPLPTTKVVLQREKKARHGKTVTRVAGLAEARADNQRWSKWLKRQLGCGATVEGDDVVLLGDVLERAATLLEKEGVRQVVRGN